MRICVGGSGGPNFGMLIPKHIFVIDVESVGLYGEGFAVAGGIYTASGAICEFRFACPSKAAAGIGSDREWVALNVPAQEATHPYPDGIRHAFWGEWEKAKSEFPEIIMAGECIYPVETGFVAACIRDDENARRWHGPYPFRDISTLMLAAGMDPMKSYERNSDELPAHDPLCDARLSARLAFAAIEKLSEPRFYRASE